MCHCEEQGDEQSSWIATARFAHLAMTKTWDAATVQFNRL